MKKICLSIATVVALGTTMLQANTLSEAFTNGKLGGDIIFLYNEGNHSNIIANGSHRNAHNASIGMRVGYTTADYKGIKARIAVQGAYDLYNHDENDARNSITASNILEMYLSYSYKDSLLKVGRQQINTPLISNLFPFPMNGSFDAVSVNLNFIPETNIGFYYIHKWNKPFSYDSNGSAVQEDVEYDDGLYSVYIKNNSVKNLTVDAQYINSTYDGNNGDAPVQVTGAYEEYFARTEYKLPVAHPIEVGFAYAGASFDNKNEKSTNMYGVRLGMKVQNGTNFSVAYTKTSDDNDFPGTLGEASDLLFVRYASLNLTNQTIYAGIEAYSAQIVHKFTDNLKVRLKYINYNQSEDGYKVATMKIGKADVVDLDINYDLSHILKGLSTRIYLTYSKHDEGTYAVAPTGHGNTGTYGRYFLTYKF